jgi:hypothetical protein
MNFDNAKNFLMVKTETFYDYKSNIIGGILYYLLNAEKTSTYINYAINILKFNKTKISK